MGNELSPTLIISFILQSILFLAFISAVLYYSYSMIRNKKRIDKPGLKWLRVCSQILAFNLFLLLVWIAILAALVFLSADFAAGCTSGGGMGACFGIMLLTGIWMWTTPVIFIIGIIMYRLSTTQKV